MLAVFQAKHCVSVSVAFHSHLYKVHSAIYKIQAATSTSSVVNIHIIHGYELEKSAVKRQVTIVCLGFSIDYRVP